MKHMADTLHDLGSRVKDRDLVHNVLRGLDQRLQHAVPHMTRGRLPSFIKLRSFLLLEEQRLGRQARVVAHNALLAQAYQAHQAPGVPPPAHLHHAAPAYFNPGPPAPAQYNPAPHTPTYFNPAPIGLYGTGGAGPSAAPGHGKKKRK